MRREGWGSIWVCTGLGVVVAMLAATSAPAWVILFLGASATVCFILAAYCFDRLKNPFTVLPFPAVFPVPRPLLIILAICVMMTFITWRLLPQTFTVYEANIFFGNKDKVAIFWLDGPNSVCPSHVSMRLFIRNDQSAATVIDDLSVEAYVQGRWVILPIIDTRGLTVLTCFGGLEKMDELSTTLDPKPSDEFLDRKLREVSIPSRAIVHGWLFLDYPDDAPDPPLTMVPPLRLIITESSGQSTTHTIETLPASMRGDSIVGGTGRTFDMTKKKILPHCGGGGLGVWR